MPDPDVVWRSIPSSSIKECPHTILVPEHYRDEDDTCRCNDARHTIMKTWGYRWDAVDGRWK